MTKLLMASKRFMLMDMNMILMILKMMCTLMTHFFDEQGRFDLTKVLSNSNDNPTIEYIYRKESTGRVMGV